MTNWLTQPPTEDTTMVMSYRTAQALSESTKVLYRYAKTLPEGSEERKKVDALVEENIALVTEWDESRERVLAEMRSHP